MLPAPSDPNPSRASQEWVDFHHRILACTRCVSSGHIPSAAPVFQGRPRQPFMLVGQAPGVLEASARKPFAGRSGAELARWMKRAGFRDDAHFRSLTYMTSITKCFPGKAATGGDRRPSGVEAQQCAEWLEGQLRLQEPLLILVVGTLAQARFLPGRTLESLVGHLFDRGGVALRGADGDARPAARRLPYLLPLPHPSGASRWLNDAAHKEQLAGALRLLQRVWPRLADG